MAKYRLSQLAEEDLLGIADYGDEHFGIGQSDRYRDQLNNDLLPSPKIPTSIRPLIISVKDTAEAYVASIRFITALMNKAWKSCEC